MATLPNLGLETMETGLTVGREVFDGDMEIIDAAWGTLTAASTRVGQNVKTGTVEATTPYAATGDYFMRIPVVKPGSTGSVSVVRVDVDCGSRASATGTSTFAVGNREDTGAGGFDSISVSLSVTQRTNTATDAGVTFDGTEHSAYVRVTAAAQHEDITITLWSA